MGKLWTPGENGGPEPDVLAQMTERVRERVEQMKLVEYGRGIQAGVELTLWMLMADGPDDDRAYQGAKDGAYQGEIPDELREWVETVRASLTEQTDAG